MLNRTTIIGNVGRAPELRHLQNGTAVADFSVAVNKRYTTSAGEQREETTWFKVVCWRKLAETMAAHLTAGRQVYVEGEIKVSAYLDKQNQPAASLELTAENVTFLGAKPTDAPRNNAPNNEEPARTSDIPF